MKSHNDISCQYKKKILLILSMGLLSLFSYCQIDTTLSAKTDNWTNNSTENIRELDNVHKTYGTNKLEENVILYQNYPNPYKSETTIKYRLQKGNNIELVIYNAIGNKIKTIIDTYQESGTHEININRNNLQNGVYYYRIQVRNTSITKKMIVY